MYQLSLVDFVGPFNFVGLLAGRPPLSAVGYAEGCRGEISHHQNWREQSEAVAQQIADCSAPHVGMAQSMENAIRSIAVDTPVERRGRLAGFDIVHIQASPKEISRARTNLRAAASVHQEVAVYHTSKDNVPFVPVGTIYLSFKPDQSEAVKQAVLDKYALQLVASERNGFLTVRVTKPGTDSVEIAAKLQREKSIAVAEPDLVTTRQLRNFVLPTDELLSREWHLENTGMHGGESLGFKQGADTRVVAAWKLLDGLGSGDVVVGIIDDGFDLNHPDLANKAVFPWDFDRNSADVHPEPDLTSPNGGNWHGTACAGVAVGKVGGGQIIGAAPNARLLPVRMNHTLSPIPVAQWFDYMMEKGAWVVSCSWGAEAEVYPLPDRIAHAIGRCAKDGRNGKGCIVVFAAGNSGADINNPPTSQNGLATHPDVLAVSACSSRDEYSDYSNFGKEILGLRSFKRTGSLGHYHRRREWNLYRRHWGRARQRICCW